jgi:subtilisin family serine protease
MSPTLARGEPAPWAVNRDGTVDLRLLYFSEFDDMRDSPGSAAVLRSLGAEILNHSLPFETFRIRIPLASLHDVASLPWVRWVEEVRDDPVTWNDVSRDEIRVEEVQQAPFNLTGQNVKLGIWDEGAVDEGHGDFAGRLTLMEEMEVRNHPTHVAGTMAGDGAESDGLYKGMAPRAEIYSWSSWDSPDSPDDEPFWEMLDAVDDPGIAVSQNSWGGVPSCELLGSYNLDANYEDQLVALAGLNLVFAAGNLRAEQYEGAYFACDIEFDNFFGSLPIQSSAKNVLTVGSVARDGTSMSVFSGWGPTRDGRIKPDVVAVGGQGATGEGCPDGVVSALAGGGYVTGCGTSMSTPAVSGTLALLIERYRQEPYIVDPTVLPPPDLLKAVLLNTATDLGTPGPDYRFGYGKVNARAAVGALDQRAFRRGVVSQGDVQETKIQVHPSDGSGCDFQVLLNYADDAAPPASASTLINDLDLEVFSPGNVQHDPYRLNANFPELPAVPSPIHPAGPVEQVPVTGGEAGEWTIRVTGVEVMKEVQVYTVTWRLAASSPAPRSEQTRGSSKTVGAQKERRISE